MSAHTSTNGRKISLAEAREYIKNYDEEEQMSGIKTRSMVIKKEYIGNLLSQDGCAYLRFYMAKTAPGSSGQYTLVIVGADEEKNNLADEGQIYEELGLCPPDCSGGGSVL